jgi:hypothetical protein
MNKQHLKYSTTTENDLFLQAQVNLIEDYLKENHPYIYRTSTSKEIMKWVEDYS